MNFSQINKFRQIDPNIKHYVFFLVCQFGRLPLAALAMAILARGLGPSGMGHWAMITAAATLMHVLFINWMQQNPLLRFGKEELIKTGTVERVWNARLPFIVIGFLISTLLFTIAPGAWLKRIFQLSRLDGLLALAFFVSLIVSTEIQILLQVFGRMFRLAFVPIIITAVTALFYSVLKLARVKVGLLSLAVSGVALITIAIWIFVNLDVIKLLKIRSFGWDTSLSREMMEFAWPILPTTILGYLFTWGNQVILRQFYPTHVVGLYQTAFQIFSVILSAAVPFTTIIVPRLIAKHLEDTAAMKRYVNSVAPTLFCLWAIAVVPLITILPTAFILIYGPKFSESIPALTLLLCSAPFAILGQIYTVLYTVQKRMKSNFWILAVMVAINLISMMLLLPLGGIYACSGSYCLAFISTRFLMYFSQHRVLGESTAKLDLFFVIALLLSLIQVLLHSLGLRLLWGTVTLLVLIFIARKMKAVDPVLLERLFKGPLDLIGRFFIKILAPS